MSGVWDQCLGLCRPLPDSRPLPAVSLQQLLLQGLRRSHDKVGIFSFRKNFMVPFWSVADVVVFIAVDCSHHVPRSKGSVVPLHRRTPPWLVSHQPALIELQRHHQVAGDAFRTQFLTVFLSCSLSVFQLNCSGCDFKTQFADRMASHLIANPEHYSATCHTRSKNWLPTYTSESLKKKQS